MKKSITFIYCLFAFFTVNAQVTLSTDFTNSNKEKKALSNIWTVANRISPTTGAGVRPDIDVNLIRMIGGINKKVNGVNVPDLSFDTVAYDEATGTYVYNWTPLISRMNRIVNSNTKIYQLVLDQVPWAFQHGYTFIPEGTFDGVNFREDEKVTIYGNSLPPFDKVAYFNYIKALMQKLIDTYGIETVASWRLRIGSEIETPDHWKGTEQDFIEHFANTVKAVREVLPNAIIGLHTREPDFVFKNGTIKNYKGETIKSFANGLINYCYDNNITYNFWGISDYILINNATSRKVTEKYNTLFEPLKENPKWNKNATLDIMEYSVVTSMQPPVPDGKGTLSCVTSHTSLVNLGLAHVFYKNEENGLEKIFRWGQRPESSDPIAIEVLKSMEGKIRYETDLSGEPLLFVNEFDAIFSKSELKNEFDVLVYNYTPKTLNYFDAEAVTISFKADVPVGTTLYYQDAIYGKDQNAFQNFLENEPASGWVKSGWDRKADPSRSLNEAGAAAWSTFVNPNPYKFNDWKSITTTAPVDGTQGSVITIKTDLPSFSFRKFEIRENPDFIATVSLPKIKWDTNEDFEEFSTSQMTTSINNNLFNITVTGSFPKMIRNQEMQVDFLSKFKISLKNETSSDIFWFVWYKNGVKNQKKFTASVNDATFKTYTVDLSSNANWSGNIDSFNVEIANKAGSGDVTVESLEFLLKAGVAEHQINVEIEGLGFVNPISGKCYTGQTITFSATPNDGWNFQGWTGNVTSADSSLVITANSDINIKATFSKTLSINDELFKEKLTVYPNPSKTGLFLLNESLNWQVYNISGSKIKEGKGSQIDLTKFNKGLYFLKTDTKSFKLLKL
ncbi:InlB B-repeat-containing protein [Polaribacter butkevichii]|uniref:Bacterial repeat domain-containing protein n=1 Tax=Polaribacter butkevichii TaxID=218490 RepID=A0A2P6CCL0_9FLAO|nr:T9SS type A sorting domain-containing protein [Polaribacter butkevichii]PQJ72647.1 hypothetical protein BTO14_04975 [Polaribacter butkevichii]